jgi:rhodanese-related sulfurtransferase
MLKKINVLLLTGLLALGLTLSLYAQGAKPAAPVAEKKAVETTAPAPAPEKEAPIAEKKPAEIPKKKQTTLGLYVTAKEAYDMWQKDPEKIKILDCRTPQEYAFVGHAPMAVNIPSKFMTYKWDAKKKRYAMKANRKFVREVKKVFKPTDTILVMCRSGDRSARSVDLLAKAGYKHVYSIVDGFEGDLIKNPQNPNVGKRMKNGWRNSGLPWTYKLDPKLMYLPYGKPKTK